jgi:prepilin-type N-terminal cleavage/methylation domain-containing protein
MKYCTHKRKKNAGFTLIETLVSLALFSVVLVIAGGTTVSVIDINKRNQAISSVVNNLNYSIDSMIRDIKTGYLYKCDYDDTMTVAKLKEFSEKGEGLGCRNLTLVSTISGSNVVVNYEFIDPTDGSNGYIEKKVYDADSNPVGTYSITDKINVKIENVGFDVKNPDALDCERSDCDYGR